MNQLLNRHLPWRFQVCVLVTAAFSTGALPASAADPAIPIGSQRELLVDDYLVDTMQGVELRLHQPTPREVVLRYDRPWEGNSSICKTVFQDGDLYRMYYRGSGHYFGGQEVTGRSQMAECYAESNDGIHWTRPNLGIVESAGSMQNNIILDVHPAGSEQIYDASFVPFKDTNPDCPPEAKYKTFARKWSLGYGLHIFKSPDAVHWSLMHDKPVITDGEFDSFNVVFWDRLRKKYVSLFRDGGKGLPGGGYIKPDGFRTISTASSNDFVHWTATERLDFGDAPDEHLYHIATQPYHRAPHLYVGFPMRFVNSRPSPSGEGEVSDVAFMTSRDGLHFKRWDEAVIRPGLRATRWGDHAAGAHGNNSTAVGIVETASDFPGAPNELSIYSLEGYCSDTGSQLRRYTFRLDGFASAHASSKGGELVTKPLMFKGDNLEINFSTSAAGSVRVGIQNVQGKPIDGFALADCPDIYGDAVDQVVAWKGGSNVGSLAGRPVRLRFELKDADLYAYKFCSRTGDAGQTQKASNRSFQVGTISMHGIPWKLAENYQRLEAYVREAARRGANVVVAPETVLDGFVCGAGVGVTRERMLAVAQPVPDGPYLLRARALCTELGIYLVFGFLERSGDDLRNSCVLIDPQGQVLGRYSKVYPNGELFITAGRELRAVDTPLGRVGFLICADRAIAANYPPLGLQNTQIVFLPMDGGGGPGNTQALRHHAREHGYWIIIANTWSRVIIDPSGEVLLEDYTTEGVSVQQVTISEPRSAEQAEQGATLDELLKQAFSVTQDRWDGEGQPTPNEVQSRDKFRTWLNGSRQHVDARVSSPDFGVGDGLVNFSNSDLSDAGLLHLKRFSDTLQGLWLQNTQITDDEMVHLANLENLRLLNLRGTLVTDAGIEHLGKLSTLRFLDLNGTDITDAGLSALKKFPDLQWLYLNGTNVTDAGLVHFGQMNQLQWLFLEDTAVTEAAIMKLKQVLPSLVMGH